MLSGKRSKRFWIAGLCLAWIPWIAHAEDWPQFRGPNRDGVSAEKGLRDHWPEGGPQVIWRRSLGEGFSAISYVAGRLYTMFGAGENEFAVCLKAEDGEEVWRVRTGKNWQDRQGNGPRSTPTVDSGAVYVLGARAGLYAIKAEDGVVLWKRDLQKDFGAKPPQWGVSTSPLVEGDLLLVDAGAPSGGSIVALNKRTGEEVWSSEQGIAGYAAPIAITVDGLRQVLFFTGDSVVSLSPKDGKVYWKLEWKTSWDVNAATPVFVPPDKVFISSGYDKGAVLLRVKKQDDGAGVEELWSNREMKNRFSSSVLHEGHLYGFDESTLKSIDVASGETRWRARGLGHGSLIYADGHLIILGDAGRLVLARAAPETYEEKSSVQVFKGKTWTVPTLAAGRLYLRDESELICMGVGD